MNRQLLTLLLGLVIAMNAAHAQPRDAETKTQRMNVFWSGHSLTDPPIPEFVAEIAGGFGTSMQWNRHSMAGASLQARTRGRPPSETGWDGYRQGYNRDTENMDVIAEFRNPRTIDGDRYDVLVITEVHSLLWAILGWDTVRLLRHYHERYIEGNPNGQTFFYEAWLGVNDLENPRSWMDYERAASPVWQCVATRVNASLAAEGREDRIASLPAGLALVELVERATSADGVPGVSGDTVLETINNIFSDGVHLTRLGAYYISLVSYSSIDDTSPIGAWKPADIDDIQARALQQVAWEFVSDYRASNKPLALAECRALVRDSFADLYWRYVHDGHDYADLSWHAAVLERLKNNAKRIRNSRNWRKGFAEDAPDNPFNYHPATDASYWHPAP